MAAVETVSYPQKIGKYEILGLIGRGGMGMVYSGRDAVIDRVVAIKTIRIAHGEEDEDKQRERLRMEARSAGKLQHPNVVTIYDYGEEGEVSYIVMEFVEGANLSRVIQKRMPLTLATRIDLMTQVARGLAYAHDCGVIHRDLKPSNICVTKRGVPKILDFGLARVDNTRLTKTGYLSGTVAYMSPERFGGESGPQDDIFALGAVAYELLTGQRAFPGETTPEVIAKIISGHRPRPISELTSYPPEVDEVVFRAMERDPANRYTTASDFENALIALTHTDVFRAFASEEARLPEFSQRPDWRDETLPPGNPYSSSRNLSSVVPTEINAPPPDPTLLATKPANARDYATRAATPFVEPRRRRAALAIGVGALIIVAAGSAYLLRPEPQRPVAKQAATVTAEPSAPPPVVTEVKPVVVEAMPVVTETTPVATVPKLEPKPAPRPARKRASEPKAPVPVPVPVVAQPQPPPQPQPQPIAPPQPAPPSRADHERDIRSFFAAMAAAYQQKDVAFFRERSLRFSNEMANAIRNSPSVRVDIAVGSVELKGDHAATVAVRRTDTFAESRVAPAVQNLVYELVRGPSGWRIASVERR